MFLFVSIFYNISFLHKQIPLSSAHPDLQPQLSAKRRVIALNKKDLANPNILNVNFLLLLLHDVKSETYFILCCKENVISFKCQVDPISWEILQKPCLKFVKILCTISFYLYFCFLIEVVHQ